MRLHGHRHKRPTRAEDGVPYKWHYTPKNVAKVCAAGTLGVIGFVPVVVLTAVATPFVAVSSGSRDPYKIERMWKGVGQMLNFSAMRDHWVHYARADANYVTSRYPPPGRLRRWVHNKIDHPYGPPPLPQNVALHFEQ